MRRPIPRPVLALMAAILLPSSASAYCTLGFWKNHPEVWCTDTLQLGDVVYSQVQLVAILHFDSRQNGLVSLAHQLIAAKLNVACDGAEPSDCIAEADAMIGSLLVPPMGFDSLPAGLTSPVVDCLAIGNESVGGEMCLPTAFEESSWGRVKATYR